ncbi:MAG: hypothetical protein CFE36_13200 [Sphingomonadaceae bacterium PASS1]|nr:MAG: hypothetical protein CFE36_13200 [Sphingomonadaceae bacterium PASS1]
MPKKSAKKPAVKKPSLEGRLPPYKLAKFEAAESCSKADIERVKIQEIMGMIWMATTSSEAERHALLVKATDMFNSFKVVDVIEGMLAVQMIGTHNAIVECFRRAMIPDQRLEAQKVYLSQAERLMGLYTRHLTALDKHRGKGQQNITVRHVNVASGGQAIVGNIDAGQNKAAPVDAPPALEKPDAILPAAEFQKTTRRKVLR